MSLMEARDMLSTQADGSPITNRSFVHQLVDKWSPMLEGIEREIPAYSPSGHGDYVKAITAFMLESQMRSFKNMTEETRAGNVGSFMKFVFPVIRRAAVRLVATSIASVQPMTGPVGGIAFYRPQYADSKGTVVAGTEMNKSFNRWYSSNFVDGETIGTGDAATLLFAATLAWIPVTASSVTIKVAGTTVGTDNGSGAITVVAASGLGSGTINYATGQTNLTFTTAPALAAAITVEYKYNNELNPRIPSVQLAIELKEIRAEKRQLKSLASVEAADDLRALWGRDIDADLVATMADEMTAEIDREILGTAFAAVEPEARVTWDRATPSGISDPEHLKSLTIQMNRASQFIHRRTQRSGANWAVTSSEVAALLNSIDGFQAVDDGNVYQGGVQRAGVLNRQFMIYIDPQFPANKVLMGYQGPSILDTGIIYSPYVPLEITPAFIDPNDMSIRRAVRTRHKVTLTRPEFFAMVDINNLTN